MKDSKRQWAKQFVCCIYIFGCIDFRKPMNSNIFTELLFCPLKIYVVQPFFQRKKKRSEKQLNTQ